jgi:hypothetical protein
MSNEGSGHEVNKTKNPKLPKLKLSSLFAWYPLIEKVVSTPKTVMIPMKREFRSFDEALSYEHTEEPEMRRLIDAAIGAVPFLGGYPIFLRSDETSNKHGWRESCFVTSDQEMERGVKNILEFTLMQMFGLSFGGIVVREFLELPHVFHAFSGMPVSREFRYFVKNGSILCRHQYWFPSCMRRVDREDWLPRLRKLQVLDEKTKDVLDGYALKVSEAVEPLKASENCWSVDFCFAKGRGWVLTDMAVGNDSYHYTRCPNSPEDQKKMYPDPEDLSEVTTLGSIKKKALGLEKFLNEAQ